MSVSGRPHDALFRALLDEPRRASALIRDHLPPAIAVRLSPDLPVPVDGTFIDPDLRESRSDRLFRVALADGRPALLYVLLEHKSRPDPGTPLQVLGYMVRIWQREAEAGDAATMRALPPILPLVFYHGREPWTVPTSVLDCLDADAGLLHALSGFRYILRDLGPMAYEELATDRPVRAALGALKYAFAARVGREVLTRLLADLPAGELLQDQVLLYILHVFNSSAAELKAAQEAARTLDPETPMPTIAQELYEQGRAEGIEAGRAEGIEAGRAEGIEAGFETGLAEGQAALLLRQMRRRFGTLPDGIDARVRMADTAQLERWSEAILDAPTLEALLDDGRPN